MIISILNLKGGVGKTTTAMTLGYLYAEMNKHVLLADLDVSHTLTAQMLKDEPDTSRSIDQLFATSKNIDQLISGTKYNQLELIQGSPRIHYIDKALVNGKSVRVSRFKKAITSLRERYDYIIIDTPPSYGGLLFNSIAAGDLMIIPIQLESLSLYAVHTLLDCFKTIESGLNTKINYRFLITMHDTNMETAAEAIEILKKDYHTSLFNTKISYNPRFRDASNHGMIICESDPGCSGCLEYRQLAAEIEVLKISDLKNKESVE